MQTHARLFLMRGTRIVRMFELKLSVKRIVWWYFSWLPRLVRSKISFGRMNSSSLLWLWSRPCDLATAPNALTNFVTNPR